MSYDLNSLQSDLDHLQHLLDATVETIMECDFGPTDNRVPHMDRLNALLWIARDMAERLTTDVDHHFQQIGRTCAPRAGEVK